MRILVRLATNVAALDMLATMRVTMAQAEDSGGGRSRK